MHFRINEIDPNPFEYLIQNECFRDNFWDFFTHRFTNFSITISYLILSPLVFHIEDRVLFYSLVYYSSYSQIIDECIMNAYQGNPASFSSRKGSDQSHRSIFYFATRWDNFFTPLILYINLFFLLYTCYNVYIL